MKIHESLARQEWKAVEVSDDAGVFEIHTVGRKPYNIALAGRIYDRETAHAIAALPKLYAACLRIYHDHAHNCIDESTIEQVRAALDAALCADEPQ